MQGYKLARHVMEINFMIWFPGSHILHVIIDIVEEVVPYALMG